MPGTPRGAQGATAAHYPKAVRALSTRQVLLFIVRMFFIYQSCHKTSNLLPLCFLLGGRRSLYGGPSSVTGRMGVDAARDVARDLVSMWQAMQRISMILKSHSSPTGVMGDAALIGIRNCWETDQSFPADDFAKFVNHCKNWLEPPTK